MDFNGDKTSHVFAMQARGLCRHAVSVCPSVTFVHSVETNERIFKFFSPSDSQTILVFPRVMPIVRRDPPPLMGASNARGVGKNRNCQPVSGSIACCEQRIILRCYGPWRVDDIAGMRLSLLMAGDNDEVCDTKPQRYAEGNRPAFNCTQCYS